MNTEAGGLGSQPHAPVPTKSAATPSRAAEYSMLPGAIGVPCSAWWPAMPPPAAAAAIATTTGEVRPRVRPPPLCRCCLASRAPNPP